jgi:hypothetical protein
MCNRRHNYLALPYDRSTTNYTLRRAVTATLLSAVRATMLFYSLWFCHNIALCFKNYVWKKLKRQSPNEHAVWYTSCDAWSRAWSSDFLDPRCTVFKVWNPVHVKLRPAPAIYSNSMRDFKVSAVITWRPIIWNVWISHPPAVVAVKHYVSKIVIELLLIHDFISFILKLKLCQCI